MITVACKCGTTTTTFINLKAKSFEGGWITDCCLEAEAKEVEHMDFMTKLQLEVTAEPILPEPALASEKKSPSKPSKKKG